MRFRLKVPALACLIAGLVACMLTSCSPSLPSTSYTPPAKQQSIDDSALKTPGVLKVGVNAAAAPLAGKASSSAKLVGIDVDVAAAIADRLGVKVEVVDVGKDAARALSSGQVDVVLGVDSASSEAGYWKSTVYLATGVALFAKDASAKAPQVTESVSIGAQVSSKSAWSVENVFGEPSLVVQDSLASAFAALMSGKVDYVASDAVTGVYLAKTSAESARIVALVQQPGGYCAAVGSSNAALQSAVSDAVSALSKAGLIDAIQTKWLGSPLDLSTYPTLSGARDAKAGGSAAGSASGASSSSASGAGAAGDAAAGQTGSAGSGAGAGAASAAAGTNARTL
ncbi:amino acid ABC transporter substrate-binding protein [Eggerthellaceae bacterium zg-1084]|uniref:substrate-binding periplasmic protein n=1 Tax=Berryella wangjianweii TaxID=2734634 RepID=UPI001552A55C|nr:transporter substrate-binding domain-containing protein [Berryella wangjianweii]NPD30528.1 amino acid ABC transporter substrate-binding protein [Berryella wangjianweii]